MNKNGISIRVHIDSYCEALLAQSEHPNAVAFLRKMHEKMEAQYARKTRYKLKQYRSGQALASLLEEYCTEENLFPGKKTDTAVRQYFEQTRALLKEMKEAETFDAEKMFTAVSNILLLANNAAAHWEKADFRSEVSFVEAKYSAAEAWEFLDKQWKSVDDYDDMKRKKRKHVAAAEKWARVQRIWWPVFWGVLALLVAVAVVGFCLPVPEGMPEQKWYGKVIDAITFWNSDSSEAEQTIQVDYHYLLIQIGVWSTAVWSFLGAGFFAMTRLVRRKEKKVVAKWSECQYLLDVFRATEMRLQEEGDFDV